MTTLEVPRHMFRSSRFLSEYRKRHRNGFVDKLAVDHLCENDSVLKQIIFENGFKKIPIIQATDFIAIARSIVYQQLSTSAARTVWNRLRDLFRGNGGMTPEAFLHCNPSKLHASGVSRAKTEYILGLAKKIKSGELKLRYLRKLSNEQIKENLTSLRGIGRWTADMFLMFKLGRPDVFPIDDNGLRRAIKVAYNLKRMPGEKMLKGLQIRWSPFQSVACWQLWQYLDSL